MKLAVVGAKQDTSSLGSSLKIEMACRKLAIQIMAHGIAIDNAGDDHGFEPPAQRSSGRPLHIVERKHLDEA